MYLIVGQGYLELAFAFLAIMYYSKINNLYTPPHLAFFSWVYYYKCNYWVIQY